MTSLLFEGSSLLLQGNLFDEFSEDEQADSHQKRSQLQGLSSSIRQLFAAFDNEGALLVVEVDAHETVSKLAKAELLDQVGDLVRANVRRYDIVEKLDDVTLAICLPGSGRIGMARVADALRQQVASAPHIRDVAGTATIGAVHTTESHLVDIDDLLLAAHVNLDSARAAGGNRTNWSDWKALRAA